MKYFYLLFSFFIANFLFADAWDNLTYKEAEAVVFDLERNPYIFDYCDCCSNSGEYSTTIHFLKVVSTEIIPCEWDDTYYSVRAQSIVLAGVFYANDGPDVNQLIVPLEPEMNELIYMNYTWTLHPEKKIATPFFNVITYNYYGEDHEPCKKEFAYPTPSQLNTIVKDKAYKKWYKKKGFSLK
jgi:hypothetical protein